MPNRTQAIIGVVALIVAFALGRYTLPAKVITEIKTVEVEKKVNDTKTDDQKHEKTVIVDVKAPDGTETKTTTITDDTDTKTDSASSDNTNTTKTDSKEVVYNTSKLTIAALAGANISSLSTPLYGGSVSKQILGPISVGVWGLNNGIVGASVGISF